MTVAARLRAARELYRLVERERGEHGPGSGLRDVAAAVLDGLRAVVPFDCATLGTWNAATGRHTLLADRDLPVHLRPWTESKQSVNPRFATVKQGEVPRRQTDVPPRQLWAEELYEVFLHPHGLYDGFAACLWTDDGGPWARCRWTRSRGSGSTTSPSISSSCWPRPWRRCSIPSRGCGR